MTVLSHSSSRRLVFVISRSQVRHAALLALALALAMMALSITTAAFASPLPAAPAPVPQGSDPQAAALTASCVVNGICEPNNGENVDTCPQDCTPEEVPVGAGLWLSDVCEPFAGFSAQGEMTWDTNADDKGLSTMLYAGPSADGPWTAVEVNGPPWVFTQETMNALAAAQGVESYLDLWFSMADGEPVNVGGAVATRDGHMDDLCGTTSEGADLLGSLLGGTQGMAFVAAAAVGVLALLVLWITTRRV